MAETACYIWTPPVVYALRTVALFGSLFLY
jgi:hypothetical protein